ncbi:MAG: hypothetical protein AVDCRST_MAG85-1512, partial [uncultured Solirubrobacteraceae bacterium]
EALAGVVGGRAQAQPRHRGADRRAAEEAARRSL